MKRLRPDQMPHWPHRLSVRLAAAFIGLSPSKFHRKIKDGVLPPGHLDGNNRLWFRDELEAAINSEHRGMAEAIERDWDA